MKNQNKVIIGVVIALIIVIVAVFSVVMYFKTHPTENPNIITEDLLLSFKERYSNGEKISSSELKKYDVVLTEDSGTMKTTVYEYNDKYNLEVLSLNNIIISMDIVNKQTYTRCSVLEEDIVEFSKYD